MKKVIGVIFFVIACFSLLPVFFIQYYQMDKSIIKVLVSAVTLFPFFIFHLIALSCFGFKKWKKLTGIVFVCASGNALFSVGMMALFLFSPETKQMFSEQMKSIPENVSFDVLSGLAVNILFVLLGILLIKLEKTEPEKLGN